MTRRKPRKKLFFYKDTQKIQKSNNCKSEDFSSPKRKKNILNITWFHTYFLGQYKINTAPLQSHLLSLVITLLKYNKVLFLLNHELTNLMTRFLVMPLALYWPVLVFVA